MAIKSIPGFYEPFSSLSHLIAAGVFLLLAIPMIYRGRRSLLRMTTLGIFSLGCVFLLSMSGVYHMLPNDGAAKPLLRVLDHAAIFVLIASSFTPPHGILFSGIGRWGTLLLIWSIAATGIVFKSIWLDEIPSWLGLSFYLGMGWIGLGTGVALWRRYGYQFVEPIVLGGLAYSIGAVLDYCQWPTLLAGVIRPHEVFHMFVLVGISFHWSFNYSIANEGRRSFSSNANSADCDATSPSDQPV